MAAGGAHAREHSAVDVEGERMRAARGLGLALLIAGALLGSAGLWLLALARGARDPGAQAPIEAEYPRDSDFSPQRR